MFIFIFAFKALLDPEGIERFHYWNDWGKIYWNQFQKKNTSLCFVFRRKLTKLNF